MSTTITAIRCSSDCKYNCGRGKPCMFPIQDDVPLRPINKCPFYAKAKLRKCIDCGWIGLENETGFGHNDYFCPVCGTESLATSRKLKEMVRK